ncbi:hypothetical protein ACPA9J_25700 [Pseudomonas aeruginosa]
MPRLASDGFVLSWSARALLMLLDYLPTLLSAFGLALTGLFFRRLAKGERWSQRNARDPGAHRPAVLPGTLAPAIYQYAARSCTISRPARRRACPERFDRTHFEAAYEFLKAIFLCSFGLMMSEARKLDEEVRAFI